MYLRTDKNFVKKKLIVPFLSNLERSTSIEKISATLDDMPRNPIDNAPWLAFPYKPEVAFSIGHGSDCIFLKYYVSERVVKASWFKTDDPVYEDSCVEFFIAFDDDDRYYNCEWNVLGTCKLNYGATRHDRSVISERFVATMKYSVTLLNKTAPDGKNEMYWHLTLMIPVEVFSEHRITTLSGKKSRVNFYKCGDALPVPHYLSWNNIESPAPDFHLSEYFGEMEWQ